MPRSDAEIENELQSLFTFARIHSWCTQLDELITALIERTMKGDRERVRAIIEREYSDPSESKEHLVLAVLLTAKLGENDYKTTERLFAHLHGRIDLNDQNFLRAHLFGVRHPLPSDVAYDIGSRPYLSFRRAINRGMKIRTVNSACTPSEVALYLTIIMCRVDLNEQNRAMLSFLLSRIDTELPENVIAGTFAYLRSLRSIIAELESQGDSVLSGEFRYADEPTIDHSKTLSVDPSQTERLVPEERLSEDSPQGGSKNTTETPSGKTIHDRDETNGTSLSETEETRRAHAYVDSSDPEHRRSRSENGLGGEFVTREVERTPPLDRASERSTDRTDLNDYTTYQRDFESGGRGGEESGISSGRERFGTPAEPVEAEPDAGDAQRQRGEERADKTAGRQEYTIHFNRNTRELLRIIEDLDREDEPDTDATRKSVTPIVEPQVVETAAVGTTETTIGRSERVDRKSVPRAKENNAVPPKTRRIGRARWSAAVIIVLFAVFAVGVFVLQTTERPNDQPVSQVREHGVDEVSAGDERSDQHSIDHTDAQPALPESPGLVDAHYRIEVEGDRFVWTVQSGQTAWHLFESATSAAIETGRGVEYTVPQEVTWLHFVLDVFTVNQLLDQFSIIYPGQRIILPDYR